MGVYSFGCVMIMIANETTVPNKHEDQNNNSENGKVQEAQCRLFARTYKFREYDY